MKIDNTHANNSGKKPKPAVFCVTEFLEVRNVLAVLVMIINQWKKSIYEVRKVWTWNVSPSNAAKIIFKLWYVYILFFFLWSGLCDPISLSLLGGDIPYQNSGYNVTRLYPSIMLSCYFVPLPSFLYRRFSRGIPSSLHIVSHPSDSAAAADLFFAPSKYIPSCYHHLRDTLAPVL